LQRCFSVAVIAVSIVVATPAAAQSPHLKKVLITTPFEAKLHAKKQLAAFGWDNKQWACLHSLWTKESNWRPTARNKQPVTQIRDGKRVKLHAGGIPQILGLDPRLSVPAQVDRGFKYIQARYSTPCHAWAWWGRHKWY
jgi:hypothetical protein